MTDDEYETLHRLLDGEPENEPGGNSGELAEEATLRKFRMVRTEGSREVSREVSVYNLDAIISVGEP